jgi:hypothetical protein
MEDFILKIRGHRKEKYYKSTCPQCGLDKGYVRQSRVGQWCRKCNGERSGKLRANKPGPNLNRKFSAETIEKMSSAKLGKAPWNKGLKESRSSVIDKLSKAKIGSVPCNKGKAMELEQKIKLSCSNREIEIDDFDGFTTDDNKKDRNIFKSLGLSKQCFERDDFTCKKCNIKGVYLHAHHLNSFNKFPEQRFELANLISLCESCHDSFHDKYGKGDNTEDQFTEFMKKEVYILTGAVASGKSWVAKQLTNFNVIDSDLYKKGDLVELVASAPKPLLALTIGVSTFIKNNPQFTYKLIVIQETENTINARMIGRGGKVTDTIKRRIKRMQSLAKQAIFTGSSSEVLQFLKQ